MAASTSSTGSLSAEAVAGTGSAAETATAVRRRRRKSTSAAALLAHLKPRPASTAFEHKRTPEDLIAEEFPFLVPHRPPSVSAEDKPRERRTSRASLFLPGLLLGRKSSMASLEDGMTPPESAVQSDHVFNTLREAARRKSLSQITIKEERGRRLRQHPKRTRNNSLPASFGQRRMQQQQQHVQQQPVALQRRPSQPQRQQAFHYCSSSLTGSSFESNTTAVSMATSSLASSIHPPADHHNNSIPARRLPVSVWEPGA